MKDIMKALCVVAAVLSVLAAIVMLLRRSSYLQRSYVPIG